MHNKSNPGKNGSGTYPISTWSNHESTLCYLCKINLSLLCGDHSMSIFDIKGHIRTRAISHIHQNHLLDPLKIFRGCSSSIIHAISHIFMILERQK
jgi:hypothetical protein